MKRVVTTLLLCTAILAGTACERVFFPGNQGTSPTEVFDYLWHRLDGQYSFFDVKQVDWDKVYSELRPSVNDDMSDRELFNVLDRMLEPLEDGHVNVIAKIDVSHCDTIVHRMYFDSQYDYRTVVMNYIGTDYHTTGSFIHKGLCDGRVAYVRYSSFSNAVSGKALEYIFETYKDAEGMILDMRQNGGGEIENIWRLLNYFPNNGQLLYKTQIKSGPGHNEFSDLEEMYAPKDNGKIEPYTKPVILLIDRGSYSATSFFALCAKSYPNFTLVGDYTGGGLGLPNGGELPNGWIYRFSVTRTIAPDGNNYENGVPPDHFVTLDRTLLSSGIDTLIEYAINLLINHNQ